MNEDLSEDYQLMNNIDCSDTSLWNYNESEGYYEGFEPLGNTTTKFTGDFEGNGYNITSLYINRPNITNVALFGWVQSSDAIKNVGLIDVNITGGMQVGALAGYIGILDYVNNSWSTGFVNATTSHVGGLIGVTFKPVNNSWSNANVYAGGATARAGGLIGQSYSVVDKCYATGNVTITGNIAGGLIGYSDGITTNSYATGNVIGDYAGGFAGYVGSGDLADNSYATGNVSGNRIGGFACINFGTINNSYATGDIVADAALRIAAGFVYQQNEGDVIDNCFVSNKFYENGNSFNNPSGFIYNNAGNVSNGYWNNQSALVNEDFYLDSGTSDIIAIQDDEAYFQGGSVYPIREPMKSWSFFDIWQERLNDYPSLTWQNLGGDYGSCEGISNTVNITNCCELQLMNEDLSGDYQLMNNIDCSDTSSWNYNASEGYYEGFEPVGNNSPTTQRFTGSFNGNNYNVSNLYISRPNTLYVGLFGFSQTTHSIENVGLIDVNITGNSYVAGLIGFANNVNPDTFVNNSFVSGGLINSTAYVGTYSYSGGLVGVGYVNVNNSFSSVNVSCDGHRCGGFMGQSYETISNSYSTGDVDSTASNVGGFIGLIDGLVQNSYSTGNVVGSNPGGFTSLVNTGDSVKNCYSTGNVVGSNPGGFSSYVYGEINNSYSTGDVNSTTTGYSGGFVYQITSTGLVNNSFATGNTNGTHVYTAGFCGYNNGGNISNSYWNNKTTNAGISVGLDSGTSDVTAIQDDETYFQGNVYPSYEPMASWNFINIWEERSNDYPSLIWQGLGGTETGPPIHSTPWIGAHNRLTNDLIGEWRFEGNADDETGVNNGTPVGVDVVSGRVGRAYNFLSGHHIRLPATGSLNISNDEITMSVWFRTTVGTDITNQFMIGKYENANDWAYYMGLSSIGSGSIKYGVKTIGGDISRDTEYGIINGTWTHYVVTYNGTDLVSYINGTEIFRDVGAGGNINSSSENVTIGRLEKDLANVRFMGDLDEVMIFNRSLSLSEVEELYNTSKGNFAYTTHDIGVSANNTFDPDGDNVINRIRWFRNNRTYPAISSSIGYDNVVLNMPFENYSQSSDTYKDYSIYGNNGILTNATWNSTGGHDDYGAYEFDGDGDYINCSDASSLNITGAMAISVWVKLTDLVGDHGIVAKGGNGGYAPYVLSVSTQKIYFLQDQADDVVGWETLISANSVITDTDWHHIVATSDLSVARVYLDGVEKKTDTSPATVLKDWGVDVTIGVETKPTDKSLGRYMNGSIDNVQIFNRSLSVEEVLALYNNGTSLIQSQETSTGDVWKSCITPNDGTEDGIEKCSNDLTIVNAPPTHTQPILNSTSGNNFTTDNLTVYNQSTYDDEDSVKNIINWYKDGSSITVLNMPFEGGSNSTWTKDYSGYANNGTVSNADWNSTGGYDGKGAYEFNESNIPIIVSHTNDLNLTEEITISAWVKPRNTSANAIRFMEKGNADVAGWFLGIYYQKAEFDYYASGSRRSLNAGDMIVGNWYHMVGTFNSSGGKLYLNGDLKATGPGTVLASTSGDIEIGYASPYVFNGTIDDVQIFNRSLSAEQVKALYENRTDLIVSQETEIGDTWKACITPNDGEFDGVEKCSNNLTIINAVPIHSNPWIGAHNKITDGRVAEYRFELGNSTWIYDETGDNNGTISGNPNLIDEGRVGKGYESDGPGGTEYITVSNDDSLNMSSMSLSVWVNAYDGYIADKMRTENAGFRVIVSSNGQADFYFGNGTSSRAERLNTFIPNEWQFITVTYDEITGDITKYINAEVQGTSWSSGSISGPLGHSTQDLRIGERLVSNYAPFNGTMDELLIFNRTLSVSEIYELYNTSKGNYAYESQDLASSPNNTDDANEDSVKNIINWYKDGSSITVLNMPFEGGSNSTWTKDYSGHGNNGTVTNADWNSIGGYDNKGAYEFDGDGDYITPPISYLQNFTISSWFYRNSVEPAIPSIFISEHNLGGFAVDIRLTSVNYLRFYSGGTTEGSYITSGALSTHKWYHFAVTYDNATGNASMYINGSLVVTEPQTEATSDYWDTPTIGSYNRGNSGWNGTIDDFQIYNHSLSAEQVKALYENKSQEIVSEETSEGETWKSCITPNDGIVDGAEKCTSVLTLEASDKANGTSCTEDRQCSSGYCVDGVCCNSACGGTCENCALSGTEGTCTAYASGDPEGECSLGSWGCSGSGSPNSCSRSRETADCSGVGSYCGSESENAPSGEVCSAGSFVTGSATLYSSSGSSDRCTSAVPTNGFGDAEYDVYACDGNGGVSGPDVGDKTEDCGTGCCYNSGSSASCQSSGTTDINYWDFGDGDDGTNDYCLSNEVLDCETEGQCLSGYYCGSNECRKNLEVSLTYPSNNQWLHDTDNIQFNYSVLFGYSESVTNCSLYGNFTGNWELNQTKYTGTQNNTETSFSNLLTLPVGTYIWNVLCYGSFDWGNDNNTLNIDEQNDPTWSTNSTSVVNATTKYNDVVWFSINWSDDSGVSESIFSWNSSDSASFTNESAHNCNNASSCKHNQTFTIPISKGEVFCWKFYGIDKFANVGESDMWCFTAANTLPSVSLISPADGASVTDRTPTFIWNGTDPDDVDTLTYDLNLTLVPSSLCTDPNLNQSGLSTENHTPSDYLHCLYDNGDYYAWSVRASDDGGSNYGSWSETRIVNISSEIIISMPNDGINFGELTVDESKNTTGGDPNPFTLQNDGNCLLNLTINASQLFDTQASASDYYKYKIDNKTGEEGSFDWLLSVISWQQMPIGTSSEIAIADLNWSDSTDIAEIDLLVTAPHTEQPGAKNTTVYLVASLSE